MEQCCFKRKRRIPQSLEFLDPTIVLDIKKGKSKEVFTALKDENVNVQDVQNGDTALHVAIAYHKSRITNKLLTVKTLDINKVNHKGQTPLHVAILHRNFHVISKLIKKHELIAGAVDQNGNNALHYAAMKSFSITELKKLMNPLQKSNTDLAALISCQNGNGNTPVHQSVEHGSVQTTKYLIRFNSSLLQVRNTKKETPLDIALKVGKDSLTAMLLSQSRPDIYPSNLFYLLIDANMYKLLDELFTVVHDSTMMKGTSVMGYPFPYTIVEALRPALNLYNERNNDGYSVAHICVIKGRTEILKVLLSRPNIDLTIQDTQGNTALHLALEPKYYSPDLVQILLNWLSMRKQLHDGTKQLPKLKKSGYDIHMPLWSILLAAIINKQNNKGYTPLILLFLCAEAIGEKLLVQYTQQLIDLGADVTLFDKEGNTPLFYAAVQGNALAAAALRVAGASASATNNDGLSPIDVALGHEDEKMVNTLTADSRVLENELKPQKKLLKR